MLNLWLISWAASTVFLLIAFGIIDAIATSRASGFGSPTNWWLVVGGALVGGFMFSFIITGGTAVVQAF